MIPCKENEVMGYLHIKLRQYFKEVLRKYTNRGKNGGLGGNKTCEASSRKNYLSFLCLPVGSNLSHLFKIFLYLCSFRNMYGN